MPWFPVRLPDFDRKLVAAALLLSIIGILMIYSAQYHSDNAVARLYYLKQATWLVIALAVFWGTISVPPRFYDFIAYIFYGVMLLLLIIVLVAGSTRMGAARWFALGPINFQPSELAKMSVLLALARFFAYTKLPPDSKRRLAISLLMTAVPAMLILKQPDLGTALVYFVLLISLWFFSGLPPLFLVLIISPLLFAVGVTVANLIFGMMTPLVWNRLADYQRMRIVIFLDPGRDPLRAGYQIIQSIISIGSGGLFGKGYLGGSQTRLEYLPVRHTDFVFSVLGEELGFIGGAIVIGLLAFIVYRGLQIAAKCRSTFLGTLSWGVVTIIFFQAVVNIGMTLGLMPVTGLPLPFVSYGGTSLVFFWVLIGLLVLADRHWLDY
jgi:rod shape determining protein RodA